MTATQPKRVDQLRDELHRDYDPFADISMPEHLAELAERRASHPVTWSTGGAGGGFWVLTTYDDISELLRRNNRGVISYPNTPHGETIQGGKPLIPIELDGALHRQFRNVLDPVFAPKAIAELEPSLRAAANHLIDEFIEEGRCDFVKGFAQPFPGATVMAIMGWPLEDLPLLRSWVEGLHQGLVGLTEDEANQRRAEILGTFRAYMLDLAAERRKSLGTDVTSLLLSVEVDGRRLDDDELISTLLLMMLAGLDTVQSVLAQAAVYFARRQDKWTEMFADSARTEPAIEEILRLTSPAVPSRTVNVDEIEIGGYVYGRGERLHAPLGAANRDPKYFPDPDEVDFDRPAKPHLSFGLGPHRCIGVHLARAELRIGFEEWHRRMPSFSLDPAVQPKDHLGLAWGTDDVHLVFPPGKREDAGLIVE